MAQWRTSRAFECDVPLGREVCCARKIYATFSPIISYLNSGGWQFKIFALDCGLDLHIEFSQSTPLKTECESFAPGFTNVFSRGIRWQSVNSRMARRDAPMTSANYVTDFPADVAEATKIAWNRYQRILIERRQIASRARDVVQDAKKAGFPTETVRLAHRVHRMTPEKRSAWVAGVNVAAMQFGFPPLELSANAPVPDTDLDAYLKRMAALDLERKALSTKLRDLKEAAEDNGVDFQTIKDLTASPAGRVSGDDTQERREEWFHRFDKLAAFLGWW